MTLSHKTAIRNTIADAVVDNLDVGSTDTGADVEVTNTAPSAGANNPATGTTLVIIPLADTTSFGAAATGTATAAGLPKEGTATAAGTAAGFNARDRDNNWVFSGTVGTGSEDMVLSSAVIAVDDVIRINTFTYSSSI